MSSERWSTTAIRALGRVKLTAPESARRARCTPMPLGSRSTPISGAAAESSAISTLARAETAGLTLRCAENGGWHAPLRFDLRRPRHRAKWNLRLLLALVSDQLCPEASAPVLKSPFHGHRGEYLWKISAISTANPNPSMQTFHPLASATVAGWHLARTG